MVTVLSPRALLLISLLPAISMADPLRLPDYVTEYLNDNQLEYELPKGQFDAYLLEILEDQNEPEPWAISADLNGDGRSDWAGLLRDRAGQLSLVAVHSLDTGYSHQTLTRLGSDGDGLIAYVGLTPPDRISGFPLNGEKERPVVDLTNPAVHLFYFEKASVLYYWVDGSFIEFVTGD